MQATTHNDRALLYKNDQTWRGQLLASRVSFLLYHSDPLTGPFLLLENETLDFYLFVPTVNVEHRWWAIVPLPAKRCVLKTFQLYCWLLQNASTGDSLEEKKC